MSIRFLSVNSDRRRRSQQDVEQGDTDEGGSDADDSTDPCRAWAPRVGAGDGWQEIADDRAHDGHEHKLYGDDQVLGRIAVEESSNDRETQDAGGEEEHEDDQVLATGLRSGCGHRALLGWGPVSRAYARY